MKTNVIEKGKWERELEVEVAADQIESEVSKACRNYQKQLEIPGFRKGKVPLNVVNRRFGDAIRGNVINDILPTLLEEATREAGLVPAAPPRIEKLDYEPGESLTRDQALSGAPRHDDRFFLVPPVLDTSAE